MSGEAGRWIKVEFVGFLPDGTELPTDMLKLAADLARPFGFTVMDGVTAVPEHRG